MRATRFLSFAALGFLLTAALSAQNSAPQVPSGTPAPAASGPSPQAGYVLKVKTRLVTIDVVATDARGNFVPNLKPEDFEILGDHNDKQKIAHFAFVDGSASRAAAAAPATTPVAGGSSVAAGGSVYSNEAAFERLEAPPTVLLLDALNTADTNQGDANKHMLRLLGTLPPGTPVAVFLLTNRVALLQDFTTDPALLRAAVSKLIANQVEKDPRNDPNSGLNTIENDNADQDLDADEILALAELEDFEKENYARDMDTRVRETTEALTSIAGSLAGVPGRKNLIWVSESFPMAMGPDTDNDYGWDVFAGSRAYGDQVEAASNALSDAQVAVYPVDAAGLETSVLFEASQAPIVSRATPAAALNAQINRDQTARVEAQATLTSVAENTGGRACNNTNDLSSCVETAVRDSSSYYELAFYPQDINWDGKFHKIVIRTTRRMALHYRHGYFAVDGEELSKGASPDERLRQACSDFLPSSEIRLVAQPAAGGSPAQPPQAGGLRYVVSIASDGLTVVPKDTGRAIDLQAAICQFGVNSDAFHFSRQSLAGAVSDVALKTWQTQGFVDALSIQPEAGTRRVRFAVLDVPSGLTGAVDIPISAADLAKAFAPLPVIWPPLQPVIEIADREELGPQPMGDITFHGSAGQMGALDWNASALVYRGNLPEGQSAPVFFNLVFGPDFQAGSGKYRCQAGAYVAVDPAAAAPRLRVTFRTSGGAFATVDLKGDAPQYSGTLTLDDTAKMFFGEVWKLAHCQSS